MKEFGIIGIARAVSAEAGRKAISVACEFAIPSEIIYWIGEYEKSEK